MSSDGKEPGAIWQGPMEPDRGQSLEYIRQVGHDEVPPLFNSEDQGAPWHTGTSDPLHEEDHDADYEDSQTEPASTPLELLKQVGQYSMLIIIPLLLGALACLFALPPLIAQRAYIPPVGLIPVVIVIIALTIAQGVAVYYSDSNTGLLAMASISGFFLFLLVDFFVVFGPLAALILFVVLAIISVVLVRFYVHPVAEGYVDIVYSFGKYSRTLYPGFNVLLPWEKASHLLNVGEKQWVCPAQKVQLSRNEDVELSATISYQLMPEDAHIAVTQVNQWEESLKELVLATIQSITTTFTPNDFITWPQGLHSRPLVHEEQENGLRWERVNLFLFELIRDRVALWGIQINWVRIRDVSLAPHTVSVVEAHSIADIPTTQIQQPAATARVVPPIPNNQPKVIATAPEGKNAKSMQDDTTDAIPAPAQLPGNANPSAPMLNEKVLTDAYKAVQDSKITDPDTIRTIAAKFIQVSQDPRYKETVTFDAARAAKNLLEQAKKHEELNNAERALSDEARTNWTARRPNDENLMAGG